MANVTGEAGDLCFCKSRTVAVLGSYCAAGYSAGNRWRLIVDNLVRSKSLVSLQLLLLMLIFWFSWLTRRDVDEVVVVNEFGFRLLLLLLLAPVWFKPRIDSMEKLVNILSSLTRRSTFDRFEIRDSI